MGPPLHLEDVDAGDDQRRRCDEREAHDDADDDAGDRATGKSALATATPGRRRCGRPRDGAQGCVEEHDLRGGSVRIMEILEPYPAGCW